jgi:thimet oligopeptidase
LFGLEWTPVDRDEAGTWHDEVASYDVGLEGVRIGRIHLDLHPREGKFKHAAQFDMVKGVAGGQLAEGVLVCNFTRGLMEHDEVVTLFHEFGHLVHHVLGGQGEWLRFSGVATEWDFVEAPSQMYEEWAWDAGVLARFARHHRSGEPIPAELVARLRGAEEYGKGMHVSVQMFYAALSLALHDRDPAGLDPMAMLVELKSERLPFPHEPGSHFLAAFGHLNGYSAIYYTYLWSLVIAKDFWGTFRDAPMALERARDYRRAVLEPGGSRDARDLVRAFLGRDYATGAFERWLAE